VPAAHLEPGARAAAVVGPLAAELAHLARWLDLDDVSIGRRGNLSFILSEGAKRPSRRTLTSKPARTPRPSPPAADRRAAARRARA
jgi:hypothetical protein